ncbi:MAG: LacI family DNA-binding transcriptional regulator [Microbacterium sp.]
MNDKSRAGDTPHGRATMKHVAERAGVGLSTVSRVVSGKGGVSRDKVRAVERAVRDLGYSRNDFAHTLRTGSPRTIGVVVTNISDPFFSGLVHAVEERARAHDMLVLVASATYDGDEATRVIRRLLQRRLDGLIVVAPEGADLSLLAREQSAGTPVVFVDQPPEDLDVDMVVVDNEGGTMRATRHLAEGGHRRIACIAHTRGRYTSLRRREGYRRGLEAAGISFDPALELVVAETAEACEHALRQLRAGPEPPTALVTTNGRMTLLVLEALRRLDWHPALVGFDDLDIAPLMTPPTTTVAQDPDAIGHAAANLLFERIGGVGGPRRRVVLATSLIARGSGEVAPDHG